MCDFCENIPKTDEELGKMIMNGAENIIFHDKERGFCLYGDTGDSGCPYCLDNIKFCPYCGKIVAGKIPNGYKVNEEPLPFSSDEYEEDRIDKIEKVVLGIQGFLKKETEQKIKELEEEQKRLMRETAHQQFISDLVHAKLREMRGL